MADPDDLGGITFTPRKASFWLSLFALAAIAYSGVTAWNERGFQIDHVGQALASETGARATGEKTEADARMAADVLLTDRLGRIVDANKVTAQGQSADIKQLSSDVNHLSVVIAGLQSIVEKK